jgi:hypothetical protein
LTGTTKTGAVRYALRQSGTPTTSSWSSSRSADETSHRPPCAAWPEPITQPWPQRVGAGCPLTRWPNSTPPPASRAGNVHARECCDTSLTCRIAGVDCTDTYASTDILIHGAVGSTYISGISARRCYGFLDDPGPAGYALRSAGSVRAAAISASSNRRFPRDRRQRARRERICRPHRGSSDANPDERQRVAGEQHDANCYDT